MTGVNTEQFAIGEVAVVIRELAWAGWKMAFAPPRTTACPERSALGEAAIF